MKEIYLKKNNYYFNNHRSNIKFKIDKKKNKKIRIYFKDKKKNQENKKVFFINDISDKSIYTLNKTKETFNNIYDLFKKIPKNSTIITLKNETEDFLNNFLLEENKSNYFNIKSFATFFYIDENLIYDLNLNDIINLYKDLENKYFNDISNYSSLFNYSVNRGMKKIINKKKFYKKELDKEFNQTLKPGISQVFNLYEKRKDRKVLAIDVNSMFPFCMGINNFSEIDKLIHIECNTKEEKEYYFNQIKSKEIINGIVNVRMILKNDLSIEEKKFIQKFNFFQINKFNNKFFFTLEDNFIYGMKLHVNELFYYSKYFKIDLMEIIYSKKSSVHPLYNSVNKLYDYRVESENPIIKKILKTYLVAFHSVTNQNQMKKYVYKFKDEKKAIHYFKYILEFDFLNSLKKIKEHIGRDIARILYIQDVIEHKNGEITIIFRYSFIQSNRQIHSLTSQVMANSRVHLLEFMEKVIIDFNTKNNTDVEICYVNIDGIHLSIDNYKLESFFIFFKDYLSNSELGKFKVENITDGALWFDPGRFWLFNQNQKNQKIEIIDFKSTLFNSNSENDFWKTKKTIQRKYSNEIQEIKHFLFSSTSYNNKIYENILNYISLKNYSIKELLDQDFKDKFTYNAFDFMKIKKKVFYFLKRKNT